jgi:hypothetical protein
MKQLDYIPTEQDLLEGLIGEKVIVNTVNNTLGGILSDVSEYFIELTGEWSPRYTYVLRRQIVAIDADKESKFRRV